MRTALGVLAALLLIGCGAVSSAPAEVIIENNLAQPVIIELADGRAWQVPPDGWGPTVQVEPGTRGTIYTAECVPIKDVVFERNSGFVVNPDGVRAFTFSDIISTTVEHAGCT